MLLIKSIIVSDLFLFFFFFQAEDGIRDLTVTGVQTCALPICLPARVSWRVAARNPHCCPGGGIPRGPRSSRKPLRGRDPAALPGAARPVCAQIGRASCRERV